MARHITATPAISLWASVETAINLTLKTLSMPAAESRTLEALNDTQADIRRTARHWLVG